jgi:Domain of unknown function (DUF4394)
LLAVHGCISRHGRWLLALVAASAFGLTAASAHAGSLAAGLTADNRIVTFDTAAPGTLLSSVPVVGLQAGESLLAIDYRPLTGLLYAVGSTSRGYLVDSTGQATQIGPVFSVPLSGTAFGIDFNPTVDRLRIVSNNQQNMRWDPTTSTMFADTALTLGSDVVALAYTNNTAGAAPTTAFGIDAGADALVTIGGANGSPSPNSGTVTPIGALGVDTSDRAGLDVPLGASTTAFALLTVGGVSQLYGVNLTTGAATLVGAIGPSGTAIADLAVSAKAAPTPPVPPPPPPPPPDLPPALSALSVTHRTFARGTTFRFTLSEAARVRVVFARKATGRRVGRRCLAATPARRKRAKCARYAAVGSISATGKAGRNSLAFSGRLKGRALKPGSYRASFTATDAAGQRSAVRAVSFRVVRP